MSENNDNSILFVSTLGDIKRRPDISPVEGGLNVRPFVPITLPNQIVNESLKKALKSVESFLDSIIDEDGNSKFMLDEVEFTLQVGQSGKVSIWLADVGGSISGGMKLRWKRR